jgi:hypothetical protein
MDAIKISGPNCLKITLLIGLLCMGSATFAQNTLHSRYVDYQDSIPAPPCEYVELVGGDTSKYNILKGFVNEMERKNYFQNDKGIVIMTRYRNEEGDSVWMLNPMIDDRYQDNPPTKFSIFGTGWIVLVYEDNQYNQASGTSDPKAYNKCLEDIIGNRVYLRPKRTDRWTKEYKFAGRLYNQGAIRVKIDHGKGQKVVFDQKGGHEVLPPYH